MTTIHQHNQQLINKHHIITLITILALCTHRTAHKICSLTKSTEISQLTNQSAHLWLWWRCLLDAMLLLVGRIFTCDISTWLRNGWWFSSWLFCCLLRYTRLVCRKKHWTISVSTFTLLDLLEVLPECWLVWSLNVRTTRYTVRLLEYEIQIK